ncbi:serine acetyltransferase [Lactococcus lactis]|uniref:serine acetyltransferase n=1 Tax=Lactococcus lactis TaxID=1358 RepID=UPI003D127DEA
MNSNILIDIVENNLDQILKLDLLKNKEFVRTLFGQKPEDSASFYRNVIEECEIQTEYWSRVLMFIYRFGRFIKYHCKSDFWVNVYKELNKKILQEKLNCTIPLSAQIGFGTLFKHPFGLIINSKSSIGKNCTIRHNFTIGTIDLQGNKTKSPTIGDDCYIGANVSIFGPIEIGSNSIIGGGAVVTKSFPENSKLIGVPARNINKEDNKIDGI